MKTYKLILLLSTISLITWAGVRLHSYLDFSIGCEGHMKRAADANTIEMATKEMGTVVHWAKKNGRTHGYTSFFSFYQKPDKDIGFWFENMNSSLEELRSVSPEADNLEKSNMLMKLRETLLDEGQGVAVTYPKGIEVYPHNLAYLIWGTISMFLCIISMCVAFDRRY